MRRISTLAVVALLAGACSSDATAEPEPVELTVEYGCGYGFYVSNPEQTVGLFIEYTNYEGASSGVVDDGEIGDAWTGQLQYGQELFANWCDDVLEEGEPTPQVGEVWTVTGTVGMVESPDVGCGPARAVLSDVSATRPDGTIWDMGDTEIQNEFWGCFAG